MSPTLPSEGNISDIMQELLAIGRMWRIAMWVIVLTLVQNEAGERMRHGIDSVRHKRHNSFLLVVCAGQLFISWEFANNEMGTYTLMVFTCLKYRLLIKGS